MEGTCSNPWFSAANDGMGFAEKAHLFVLGSLAAAFTKTGEWVRWFFVIYVIFAVCLCAALVMHSLIQYAISIWKITIKNTIQFRQHTAMRLVWALLCLIGSLIAAVIMSALWVLWVPIATFGILIQVSIFAYKVSIFAYKAIVWMMQQAWEVPWSLSIWLSHKAWLGGQWGFQLIWNPSPAPVPPKKCTLVSKPTYTETLKKLNDFYDAEEDGTLKKPNYHYDVDDDDFFQPETPYNPTDFVDADNRTYDDNSSSSSRDNIPVVAPYSPPQEKTQKQHS